MRPPAQGEPAEPRRKEAWVRLAYGLLALLALAYLYLAARPGGRAPVWLYARGLDLLPLLGLAVLALGLWTSSRRRPVLQRGRGAAFACLAVVVGSASVRLHFPYPSSRERRPSAVRFRLPVEGAWQVLWGGERAEHNRLATLSPDRRFALVLVKPEDQEARSEDARDHAAWGEVVVAPAAGRVVVVRDGVPDETGAPGGPGVPGGGLAYSGNYVVLRVAEGEYLFLTHLLSGSIEVREGRSVEAGDWIARAGQSGFDPVAPLPHVALHLQTTPDERWGEGVPFFVFDYQADGSGVSRGVPRGGLGPGGRWSGQNVRQVEASGSD